MKLFTRVVFINIDEHDHIAIICGTNIQKGNITRQEVSYRKINGMRNRGTQQRY